MSALWIHFGDLCHENRPTRRAPDGWWAARFELDSSEEFVRFRWLVLPAAGNADH